MGPDLPGYELGDYDTWPTGAFSGDAVVVVKSQQAWTAQISELVAASTGAAPVLGERPKIGTPYRDYRFLHCGWGDTYFDLRSWVPHPPFEDDVSPPPGFGDEDRGTLTMISANELVYESRRGQVVRMVPTDTPEKSGPCA